MHRASSRFVVGFFLFLVCSLGPPVLASEGVDIGELAWMEGRWAGGSNGVQMEEIWTAPKGGVMLGLHRDVVAGRPAFFEYLRIEDRDGRPVYIASPRGSGATEFALVSVDGQQATFENPDHDFPQRIIYRREGGRLTARTEGEVDGELRSSEWTWTLAR